MYAMSEAVHVLGNLVSIVLMLCITVVSTSYSLPLWLVGGEVVSLLLCISYAIMV